MSYENNSPMKSYFNELDKRNLPEEVRVELESILANKRVELIFYSQNHIGRFIAITIVQAVDYKQANNSKKTLKTFNESYLQSFGILVTVVDSFSLSEHSEFSYTYYYLNCQQCDFIYVKNNSSWKQYGQLYKNLNLTVVSEQLENWSHNFIKSLDTDLIQYVEPLWQSGDFRAAYSSLKVVLQKLLHAFQSFILPENYHIIDLRESVVFLKRYMPSFDHYLDYHYNGWGDLRKLEVSASSISVLGDDAEYIRIKQLLTQLKNYLNNELTSRYLRKLKKKIRKNKVFLIEERARAKVLSNRKLLANEILSHLLAYEESAWDYIYLVGWKSFDISNNAGLLMPKQGYRFLFILLGVDLSIEKTREIQNLIASRFPNQVKLTLLVYETRSFFEQLKTYPIFFEKVMKNKNCLYSRSGKHLKYFPVPTVKSAVGVAEFWVLQKDRIDECWGMLAGVQVKKLKNSELLHLEFIFSRTALALLYSQIYYAPEKLGVVDLWELLKWFFPELEHHYGSSRWTEVVYLYFGRLITADPKEVDVDLTSRPLQVQELYVLCRKLYRFAEKKLNVFEVQIFQ